MDKQKLKKKLKGKDKPSSDQIQKKIKKQSIQKDGSETKIEKQKVGDTDVKQERKASNVSKQSEKSRKLSEQSEKSRKKSEQKEEYLNENGLNEISKDRKKKDEVVVNEHNLDKSYFSDDKFEDLEICELTKTAIKEQLKFSYMTQIQSRTINHLLKGRDLLGAAKTGSGKTLAFLIPAIELLYKYNYSQKNGTGVIVITPTRELALQIFNNAKELLYYHNKTVGLIIGGANRKQEQLKLQKGVNLIIATPGRLLDHLQNTNGFSFHNLLSLVIDEADAILKIGFEQEMNQILSILPNERQSVLFSATQTQKVDDLARLSLKQPIYIGVDDDQEQATVSKLEQGYIMCPSDKRFLLLFTFLQKFKSKKIMVFFSSCNSVKFHSDLLNYIDISVLDIHGRQKQSKRMSVYYEFCNAKSGALLCTDVAARGLDIPQVDWIIQFDPPDDTKEYIHRVGRTCRGANTKGKALLFLLPEEKAYLKHLRLAKVQLNEFEFPQNKLANVQEQFDKLIQKNYYLNKSAFEAYKSYLNSYQSHGLKEAFEVANLDLQKTCRAFGFQIPPRVDLSVRIGGKSARKSQIKNQQLKSRHFKKEQKIDRNFSR